jgi:putative spermidine/putrescine transport system substrate-binding protein
MQITASTKTISALTLSLLCLGTAHAAPSVTFAGWGGALQDAERKAYLEPWV